MLCCALGAPKLGTRVSIKYVGIKFSSFFNCYCKVNIHSNTYVQSQTIEVIKCYLFFVILFCFSKLLCYKLLSLFRFIQNKCQLHYWHFLVTPQASGLISRILLAVKDEIMVFTPMLITIVSYSTYACPSPTPMGINRPSDGASFAQKKPCSTK